MTYSETNGFFLYRFTSYSYLRILCLNACEGLQNLGLCSRCPSGIWAGRGLNCAGIRSLVRQQLDSPTVLQATLIRYVREISKFSFKFPLETLKYIYCTKWFKQHKPIYIAFIFSQWYTKVSDYRSVGLSNRRTIDTHHCAMDTCYYIRPRFFWPQMKDCPLYRLYYRQGVLRTYN